MSTVSVSDPAAAAAEAPVPRWRAAVGQGAWIFAGYGVIALVGMGALRVWTELAPKSVFGESNLLLTMLTLGMQLFVAPFTNTQLRYHTEAQARGEGDAFTRESLAWAVRTAAILGFLAFAACLLCGRFGGPVWGAPVSLAALVWAFATAARNVLMSRLQAERRRMAYTGLMVIEAVLVSGLTAVALYVWPDTSSFVLGQLLGAVALIFLSRYFVPWPRRSAKGAGTGDAGAGFRQKVFEYGMPFAPLALVGWLSNLADRYVLGAVLGAAAVGQYVAPLSIGSRIMIMASGALNDLFRPALFDAENRGQLSRANSVFRRWIAVNMSIGCAAVVLIAVAGDRVVGLLLGKSYREGAVAIMIWIASGYGVYGLTQVLETRLLSLGRSGQLLIPMAAGATANIAFSVLLVPRFGIIGAARASCLSFVAQGIVTALFLISALRRRRLIPVPS